MYTNGVERRDTSSNSLALLSGVEKPSSSLKSCTALILRGRHFGEEEGFQACSLPVSNSPRGNDGLCFAHCHVTYLAFSPQTSCSPVCSPPSLGLTPQSLGSCLIKPKLFSNLATRTDIATSDNPLSFYFHIRWDSCIFPAESPSQQQLKIVLGCFLFLFCL